MDTPYIVDWQGLGLGWAVIDSRTNLNACEFVPSIRRHYSTRFTANEVALDLNLIDARVTARLAEVVA